MKKILSILAFFMLAACTTNSKQPEVLFTIDYVGEFYPASDDYYIRSENTGSSTGSVISSYRILAPKGVATDRIKIMKGIDFGLEFSISGLDDPKGEIVTFEIRHPPIKNDITGEIKSISRFESQLFGIHENQFGWYIERDSEVVTGKWTFRIFYEGKSVLEQTIVTY